LKRIYTAIAVSALTLSATARAEYVITVTAKGIEVTNNWQGASVPVAGSPFVESPLLYYAYEEANPPPVLAPTAISLDPAGAYLYAFYERRGGGVSNYTSFAVESNGTLKKVSDATGPGGDCATCSSGISVITASAHYLAVFVPQEGGLIYLMSTKNGVMTGLGSFSTNSYITGVVTSIQIDPSEHWMYVNYSSKGGTGADTAVVYSMQSLPKSLVYVSHLAVGTGILIVP